MFAAFDRQPPLVDEHGNTVGPTDVRLRWQFRCIALAYCLHTLLVGRL